MVWISIDRSRKTSLKEQIISQLRASILNGERKAGEPLPSTRQLALDLQVSRNILLEAYDQLTAEGYLEGKRGRGTFVAEGALLARSETPAAPIAPLVETKKPDIINFRSGVPALDLFPRRKWSQLAQQVLAYTPSRDFGYDSPEGRFELRSAIAKYVYRVRGVRCSPEQVLITSGATQAITLVAKLCARTGEPFVLEDPITNDIQTIFAAHGARLVPLPVDEAGIDPSELTRGGDCGSVYVTPSHQYPLGSILPIQRRVQLIEYARRTSNYIIEDDYDSEFRYEGDPIPSLQGLDPNVVIYLGTFSKILSPALRIGYMILPLPLIERCRQLKWFSDLHTPSLEQLILARFLEEGHLERHIRQMKKVYKRRRDAVRGLFTRTFEDDVRISGDSTGLHLIAEFVDTEFTDSIIRRLYDAGVFVQPVRIHSADGRGHGNKLIIGYGNLQEQELAEGIDRIRSVLADIRRQRQTR
ncbi:PLP-dependent aminotransferase family protein [Paenibacillus antri]|uniref:PLP-dependent aminotransferase family protein n=1 Tax=Paenibacillus antri TaxID=2582848 RepID=A0A5R9GH30_9BACL|nr:PLP-dependent aminotransferase family protein [Paenibacillus antri]TLS52708.1 PLP-dependent aminotransferase family protein [Paenibacillus antri]